MEAQFKAWVIKVLSQISTLESEVILLVTLFAIAIIVLDAVQIVTRKSRKEAGVGADSRAVSIDGGKSLKRKLYISDIQGLSGTPDAVINEGGFFIPIERKPLARKLRDRHKAQLLVYMRLVEEFEGRKPPYGYLILGAQRRKIKVPNSEANQLWLQRFIDEMRAVLDGAPLKPLPDRRKCSKCSVNEFCSFRADKPQDTGGAEKKKIRL